MPNGEDPLIDIINKPFKINSNRLVLLRKKKGVFVLSFIIVCLFSGSFVLQKEMQRLRNQQKIIRHSIKALKNKRLSNLYLGRVPIPDNLSLIPYAEDLGVVTGVKTVHIRNVKSPYNASLVPSISGYELFFRYDVPSSKSAYNNFYSRIGVVHLDDQFEQEDKEFKRIDLQTEYAEDPRVLLVNDNLYMFYNALTNDKLQTRSVYVASINREDFYAENISCLNMNLKWVEKNWSPFEYIGKDQKPRLFIEYQMNPHTIFELSNPETGEINNLRLPQEASYLSLFWPKKWGEIRGGTPAKKIGNEYLGFFHSSFEEDGLLWYVMGAYTFQKDFPFRITGISEHPILFRGIFETPHANTAPINKLVIFPSGFVIEKKNDKELIHVVCGENDSSIKIVTINKEKLMATLNRFEN